MSIAQVGGVMLFVAGAIVARVMAGNLTVPEAVVFWLGVIMMDVGAFIGHYE